MRAAVGVKSGKLKHSRRETAHAGRECTGGVLHPSAGPDPRRAPRGGSLLGLLLPAPLGAGPWRGAVCGACTDARMGNDGRVLRSVRAAQRQRIRIKPAAAQLTRAFFAKCIWLRPSRSQAMQRCCRRRGSARHRDRRSAFAGMTSEGTPDLSASAFQGECQGMFEGFGDPTEEPCSIGAVDQPVIIGY